jgi:hypothetical protein
LPREPTLKVAPDAKSSLKDGWVRQAFLTKAFLIRPTAIVTIAPVTPPPTNCGRCADVEAAAAGGRAERRDQGLQNGSADPAAGRTRNRFDEGAKVDKFFSSAPTPCLYQICH